MSDSTGASVEVLSQLARAQALQGKLVEARATLDHIQKMISVTSGELDPRAEIRWLLEAGRLNCLSMSPARAHDLFARAWTRANETNQNYFAIEAALMLSVVRPPKFQNEWLKKALELAETATDPACKIWLAQLLFLEGWHAYDFRQFDKALASFERALAQPSVVQDESKGFSIQWSRARTLRALGRVPEALEAQKALLTKLSGVGRVSGYVYLEVAECHQLLKHKDDAKSYFELAYAELSVDGWFSDNKMDELDRMKYLFKKY